jgi:hypothetical protein
MYDIVPSNTSLSISIKNNIRIYRVLIYLFLEKITEPCLGIYNINNHF